MNTQSCRHLSQGFILVAFLATASLPVFAQNLIAPVWASGFNDLESVALPAVLPGSETEIRHRVISVISAPDPMIPAVAVGFTTGSGREELTFRFPKPFSGEVELTDAEGHTLVALRLQKGRTGAMYLSGLGTGTYRLRLNGITARTVHIRG
ncbi:MAG: hypothetical protein SF053_09070 [Bacteroidia bacterium]|nr:hypothetical protein [Bacteroidia bacterium]